MGAGSGIDIAGDLSIIGFDDIPEAVIHILPTIRQPAIEMGSEAVKLLFRLLAEENVPSRIVTPVMHIERQTARKIS